MEIWDAYDENFNIVEGRTLVRGEEIPAGLHHLVADVLVRHEDGSYLLMKRSPNKHFGGMWEATAGGSALKGESPYDCAVRELKEETGISVDALQEVARSVTVNTVYVEYLAATGCEKNSVTLQEGETCDFRWVSREELIAMRSDELVSARMRCYLDSLNL